MEASGSRIARVGKTPTEGADEVVGKTASTTHPRLVREGTGTTAAGGVGHFSDARSDTPTVYLARHGETTSNLERRYAGSSSEPLTGRGRQEVEQLASRLAGTGIGQVWTSEVTRARESAEVLGKRLGVPVVSDSRLNELRMGPWEGLTERQVAELYPREWEVWRASPDRLALEGRETLEALAERVLDVVTEALASPQTVLIVSHVAPIRVAALKTLGLPLAEYKRVQVRNAECFQVMDHAGDVRRLGSEVSIRSELASREGLGRAR